MINVYDEKLSKLITKPKQPIPCPSYLRLESTLEGATLGTGSTQTVNFNVLANQGNPLSTEVRLKTSDVFFTTAMGVYLYVVPSTTTSVDTPVQHAEGVLYTAPNNLVVTTSGQAAALQNLYNGNLAITIDTVQYFPNFPAYQFYRVGALQQGVTYWSASTAPVPRDEWNGPFYGQVPLGYKGFQMSGAGNNIITLNMPQSIAMGSGTSSSYRVYACMILSGFLKQNAAQFANDPYPGQHQ